MNTGDGESLSDGDHTISSSDEMSSESSRLLYDSDESLTSREWMKEKESGDRSPEPLTSVDAIVLNGIAMEGCGDNDLLDRGDCTVKSKEDKERNADQYI